MNPIGSRANRFLDACKRLGIEHYQLALDRSGPKLWRCDEAEPWESVENAALSHFRRNGWEGVASEGGAILSLIKAASFPELPVRHADTFTEALYALNIAPAESAFATPWLLSNVLDCTPARITANCRVIFASAGHSPAFYPSVRREHLHGLFDSLGVDRLHAIATRFAKAPYDLRAGWPDLTLWKAGEVLFLEVKAPGDQLQKSQRDLISTLLVPLGLRAGIVEVVATGTVDVRHSGA